MAKRKISECGELFTGFSLSSQNFAELGSTTVIQLRDVSKEHIKLTGLKRTDMSVSNPDKFIRKGDVLFKSRGHVLEAFALMHEPEQTIVTNGFIVVRPHSDVIPRYLAWVLNNTNFDRMTQQTHMIKSVSIRDLRNLDVPMPDRASQEKIIQVSDEIDAGKELAADYFYAAEEYLRSSVFNR
ncbi:restriction endonuclease subunit S [Alphaproteobacteria bacterium LSUCC0684]